MSQTVQDGQIPSNPADRATPPTTKEAAPPEFTVWTAEQVSRFLVCERKSREFP
ncbi:hypothetical protein OG762_21925 [Streptomyces sp. NBC_01136]|uniref:hypothetical protein n=1 Tax=unclassified Streptomyces TaxID=2593676 RepID=UPI0032471CAD|nr:hypothetical protein OG762_21925 [Streptomyces sp. NBC_01136]